MKVIPYMDEPISQAEFAQMIGVSEARVSQLVAESVITRGDTAAEWLVGYCERLRDQAAGRMGETNGLDLVQERAALARSQRIAQDMKNAVAAGEFAPIGLLTDVLSMAASAVVDRFDHLEGMLKKSCPDLPDEARETINAVIAAARNEWVASTSSLVVKAIEELLVDDESEPGEAVFPEGTA